MKKVFGVLLTLVLCLGLTGCGGSGDDSSASGNDVSGNVSLNGSTSMEKFVNALKEAITEEYPNLTLEPQFTGSGAGIEAVTNGTADIGDSSRALKDEEKAKGIEDACKYAQELNETGAVMAKVSETAGAIGYVSLDVVDDTVKSLKLDGVKASEKTIKDGSYTLQRPFVMATKGKISEQSKEVQAVFDFINSEAGQKVIEQVGLIIPDKK